MTLYSSVNKASGALGETNDCGVKALAIVTGLTYVSCLVALQAAGRKVRSGTSPFAMESAAKALGFRIKRRWNPDDIAVVTRTRLRPALHHPLRYPEEWSIMPDMLIFSDCHASALKNGKLEDHAADSLDLIEFAWELERATATVALGQEPPPVIYLKGAR